MMNRADMVRFNEAMNNYDALRKEVRGLVESLAEAERLIGNLSNRIAALEQPKKKAA